MEVKDKTKVGEYFVEYFTEMACEIGDPELLALTEDQLGDHKSVESITKDKERDKENLKVNKSCGYDSIPNILLKLISGPLAPSLTYMFNA